MAFLILMKYCHLSRSSEQPTVEKNYQKGPHTVRHFESEWWLGPGWRVTLGGDITERTVKSRRVIYSDPKSCSIGVHRRWPPYWDFSGITWRRCGIPVGRMASSLGGYWRSLEFYYNMFSIAWDTGERSMINVLYRQTSRTTVAVIDGGHYVIMLNIYTKVVSKRLQTKYLVCVIQLNNMSPNRTIIYHLSSHWLRFLVCENTCSGNNVKLYLGN